MYLRKNTTRFFVGLLKICQGVSVYRQIVYRSVMTNCCFRSHLLVEVATLLLTPQSFDRLAAFHLQLLQATLPIAL